MQRTLVFILLFALVVGLTTSVSSWVTWRRVGAALDSEFTERMGRIAGTTAHEIGPAELAGTRGREAGAYLALQVQLVTLRASTSRSIEPIDTYPWTRVWRPELASGEPTNSSSVW